MEMILVLSIIAILMGGGVALMVNIIRDAEEARARGDVNTLQSAVMRYRTVNRTMPGSLAELAKRPSNANGNWRPMVETTALVDPWKQDYLYKNPGKRSNQGYDINSKGYDMQNGTADDIGNWNN